MPFRQLALHPDIDPWEQQPAENSQCYARFLEYLQQEPSNRLYRIVAERTDRKTSTIEQQAIAHRWRERVAAWDAHRVREHQADLAEKAKKVSTRQMDVSLGMLNSVARSVQHVLTNNITLSPADAAKWLDIASRVSKMAMDQPQQVIGVTGADGGPVELSIPELEGLTPEQTRHRLSEMTASIERLADWQTGNGRAA